MNLSIHFGSSSVPKGIALKYFNLAPLQTRVVLVRALIVPFKRPNWHFLGYSSFCRFRKQTGLFLGALFGSQQMHKHKGRSLQYPKPCSPRLLCKSIEFH